MVPVLRPFTFPAPVPAEPIAHGQHRSRPGIQIEDHLTPAVAMAPLRDVEPDAPDVAAREPRAVRPAGQAAIPAVAERLTHRPPRREQGGTGRRGRARRSAPDGVEGEELREQCEPVVLRRLRLDGFDAARPAGIQAALNRPALPEEPRPPVPFAAAGSPVADHLWSIWDLLHHGAVVAD